MTIGEASRDLIDFLFLPINSTEGSAYALLDLVDRYEKEVVTVVRFPAMWAAGQGCTMSSKNSWRRSSSFWKLIESRHLA